MLSETSMLRKLFQKHIKPTKFSMYVTMKQEVFNIYRLLPLIFKQIPFACPLLFILFVSMVPIYSQDTSLSIESYTDSVKLLYKRSIDQSATEFLLCNKHDGTIREYQRKNKSGIIELSMIYDKYSIINGIPMPGIVTLSSPLRGVSLTVSAQSITVNDTIPTVMRFPLPASIKPLRMD